MTILRIVRRVPVACALLLGAPALILPGIACARQSAAQPAIRPVPPSVQFQQAAQQQQVRDKLQKSQLEQQLRQSVSDNAKRPTAGNPRSQQQLDLADQAQRDRDRARQQDLLDRERDTSTLPRVVPKRLPASARSGH